MTTTAPADRSALPVGQDGRDGPRTPKASSKTRVSSGSSGLYSTMDVRRSDPNRQPCGLQSHRKSSAEVRQEPPDARAAEMRRLIARLQAS
jgi:hypothetical protein